MKIKNNITVIIISTLLVLSVLILSGCTNNNDKKKLDLTDAEAAELIVGSWKRLDYDLDQTWTFLENGTLYISGTDLKINYWFENNTLHTYYPKIDFYDPYRYSFYSNDDLTIDLISNDIIVDPDTGQQGDDEVSELTINFERISS